MYYFRSHSSFHEMWLISPSSALIHFHNFMSSMVMFFNIRENFKIYFSNFKAITRGLDRCQNNPNKYFKNSGIHMFLIWETSHLNRLNNQKMADIFQFYSESFKITNWFKIYFKFYLKKYIFLWENPLVVYQ